MVNIIVPINIIDFFSDWAKKYDSYSLDSFIIIADFNNCRCQRKGM